MINASCAEYLIGIGFEHWARAYFTGNRYNIMTSNVAETWNSVLQRRNVKQVGSGRLTAKVEEILETNFQNSGGMLVRRINSAKLEVKDKNGSTYEVNLEEKYCSCYAFQKLQIPCPHAIASAIKEKVNIESLVSNFYTTKTLASAYAEDIVPITNETTTNGEASQGGVMFPPASRRPPGRPRKSRILSTGEIRMKTPRRRHVCSRCKSAGHNKATCKVAI
ncbi:uncharacterized protein LOC108858034 [Raphanus sativus]|uniref:Uncharacterized protein LOC108858034 n=1 Tax=Raphanus sativus TaxID=3726 RepID=A0A6J0NTS5_RAPSA|nr:uncharacterized protein LOC108858034 [Raphanus sativus]